MSLEIEHKYLVENDSYLELATSSVHILQGYLSRTPEAVVRVRIADDRGFLTVKGKNTGDTRPEFEYPIPPEEARQLLRLCPGRILDKTRYIVPYRGHMWEVDIFHGDREGLRTAEIELPSSDTSYDLPPFAGRNVTGDPAYYNSNL